MDFSVFLDPRQAWFQTVAGFGSFIAMVFSRELSWRFTIALFIIGQIFAFMFTIPTAEMFRLGMGWYPGVGLGYGLLAMFFTGGIVKIFKSFWDDPGATLGWLIRLWRGGTNPPGEK